MVNTRIAYLTTCATILATIPLLGDVWPNRWLLLSPIVSGPVSMWLCYRAYLLRPEVRFLRWYPWAIAPLAFNLIGIGVAIWQAVTGHVGAL